MSENGKNDETEGEVYRLALKVASDVTPFGMALGEMLRTLDHMDKRLAAACGEEVPSPPEHEPSGEVDPAGADPDADADGEKSGPAG